jgi:hypothetical protein
LVGVECWKNVCESIVYSPEVWYQNERDKRPKER